MKVLVYHDAGKASWREKLKTIINKAAGAVLKIRKTTISGSDFHIMKGNAATFTAPPIFKPILW